MADYYLHKRDYDEWKVVVPSKKLGKHMGYCSGKTIWKMWNDFKSRED